MTMGLRGHQGQLRMTESGVRAPAQAAAAVAVAGATAAPEPPAAAAAPPAWRSVASNGFGGLTSMRLGLSGLQVNYEAMKGALEVWGSCRGVRCNGIESAILSILWPSRHGPLIRF
jgi:hypothetical protein